jgi:ferredoxin
MLISRRFFPQTGKTIIAPFRTVLFSSRATKEDAVLMAMAEKGFSEIVCKKIVKTFRDANEPLTQSGLSKLNDSVLNSLAASIMKQEEDFNANKNKVINIFIQTLNNPKDLSAVTGKIGESLLDVSFREKVLSDSMEWACGGVAACSTCHVIVDKAHFARLPPPDEAEMDMLDLASGLTPCSRLACQIKLTEECDGMTLTVPDESNNLYSR